MADLKQQLKEDKALRNAARTLISAQVTQVRQGLSGERMGQRLADKIGDPMVEKLGNGNLPTKVIAAAVAGAASVVAVALAWKPVSDLLNSDDVDASEESEDDA